MKILSKCSWCGNLYVKKNNAQKYCSAYCKKEAKREHDRIYVNKRNKQKHHNTRIKNLVTLGSWGTSSTCHMKKSFREEHKSVRSQLKMLKL